jgi:hypothetical protein
MTKNKKEQTPIPVNRVIEALRELIKQQKMEEQGLKREKKKTGGLARTVNAGVIAGLDYMNNVNPLNQNQRNAIDKPFYSVEKKEIPNVKETIISIRKSLANGGSVSDEDIGKVLDLIEILEGGQGLRPDEQELLRNLYDDLRKMGGAKYAE